MAHPDLPGYHFDPVKNRYFPLPHHQRGKKRSQPAETSSTSHQVETQTARHVERRDVLPGLLHEREISSHGRHAPFRCNTRAFQGKYLEMSTSQFRVWRYGESKGFSDGGLEHLCVNMETARGDEVVDVLILGGTDRRLRIVQVVDWTADTAGSQFYPIERCLPHSPDLWTGEEKGAPVVWPSTKSLLFRSTITSVKRLNQWSENDRLQDGSCLQQGVIVTTLGDGANGGGLHLIHLKAESVTPTHCPLSFRESINLTNNASTWTSESDPRGRRASFGITAGAMILDLETCQVASLCCASSDVLAQQFDSTGNVVLCGFRNGVISTIDTRCPKRDPFDCWCFPASKGGQQFDNGSNSIQGRRKWSEHRQRRSLDRRSGQAGAYSTKGDRNMSHVNEFYCSHHPIMRMKSAICSLKLRRSNEIYLLASSVNGDIQEWDRRLVGRGPVRSYYGHHNSHSKLQLGMDPTERLLVSGGEDCAVRLWSLESGQLLQVHRGLPSPVTTVSWPTALRISDSQQWGGFCEGPALKDYPGTLWMGSSHGLLHGRFSARAEEVPNMSQVSIDFAAHGLVLVTSDCFSISSMLHEMQPKARGQEFSADLRGM